MSTYVGATSNPCTQGHISHVKFFLDRHGILFSFLLFVDAVLSIFVLHSTFFRYSKFMSLISFLIKKHHVFTSNFPLLTLLCADLVVNVGIVRLHCFTQLHLLISALKLAFTCPTTTPTVVPVSYYSFVHLVHILSISLWLWFQTVNTPFLLVVFLFIAVFISARGCSFLIAAVFIFDVKLLGGEEPQCLIVLVHSFFATSYRGDQDISKCVCTVVYLLWGLSSRVSVVVYICTIDPTVDEMPWDCRERLHAVYLS